jgi:hypothetical protein
MDRNGLPFLSIEVHIRPLPPVPVVLMVVSHGQRYEFRPAAFNHQTPITMYTRSIGIAALIFGTLFKVLHWPGANMLILTGGVVAALAAIALLVMKPGPKPASAALRTVTGALLIAFLMFKLFHLPFADAWALAAVVSAVGLLFAERDRPWMQRVLALRFSPLLLIGAGLVLGGTIFKVMHWPSANVQLLLGMTGCAIWFLIPPRQAPLQVD